MSEAVTFAQARDLTLEYYIRSRDSKPLPFRDMPFKKVENVTLSINEVIAQIQSNTDLGQWLVAEYASGMGWIINV